MLAQVKWVVLNSFNALFFLLMFLEMHKLFSAVKQDTINTFSSRQRCFSVCSVHVYMQYIRKQQEIVGPIITQSGPKVQALIIVSSPDRKIKDLAPTALLSASLASVDPRCFSSLTADFRKTEVSRSLHHHSSLSSVHVPSAKPSLNDDVCGSACPPTQRIHCTNCMHR